MLEQEHGRVGRVLAVELGDLEFREQELGRRQGQLLDVEPFAEVEVVRHGELVEEDVEVVAPVGRVVEEAPRPVRRVEDALGLVPELFQQIAQAARFLLPGGQVEIWIRAPERLARPVRRARPDGDPAEEPQGDAAGRRLRDEAAALFHERRLGDHYSGGISWNVLVRSMPWIRR